MKTLNNTYYLLRHGRNIHQTELKEICYGWPDDKKPCELDEVGIKEVTASGIKLKDKNIDLIYSSDILRTKQTAEIVASIIGIEKIIYNVKLRDLNWGVFAGGPKKTALDFYQNRSRMEDRPENGESWGDLQKRVSEFLKEVDGKNKNKNILLISHGDAILLLEAWLHDWSLEEILEKRKEMIKTGELRKLN
ncbi:MAG: histidine phosphatase family protein [Candidatus Pacebacteria bacterium]|nr:histidine phosphatase family protein [Candidatus Paceibacterota bacterium]MDD3919398.1 histidine phosphatase family protein [Candidatus Paceibacterota bacterium]